MADKPLWGDSDLFKLTKSVAVLHAKDEEFWRLHAEWHRREDAVNLDTSNDDDTIAALVEYSDEVMLPMIDYRVSTATAILAKLEALRQSSACGLDRNIRDGLTFYHAIQRDIERLAQLEIEQVGDGSS